MIDVSVAIMTVPSRRRLRARLERRLEPLEPVVVVDEDESGDTWAIYRRCLVEAQAGSHRLVVQDDALLVDGFVDRLLAVLEEKPTRVVCLYTPALPSLFGRPMLQAANQGAPFVELATRSMFLPLVCTAWPVDLAADFAAWPGHARLRASRADDARAASWLAATRRQAVACVPCIADHDETQPSALHNGGRYSRRAAILPSTPAGELTIA